MPTLISSNFLNRYPIEQTIKNFAKQFDNNAKILDIGCGYKPYAKYFKGSYLGVDHTKGMAADVICDSASIPLSDASFDIVISTQTLEHTIDIAGTIKEIKRLLKPNGYCFISVPLIMKVHAVPNDSSTAPYKNFDTSKHPYWNIDYWRFTKFGLFALFRDFKIIVAKETSGYIGTIMQLINYFFASFRIPYIFTPLYLASNITGLLSDELILILCTKLKIPILLKFYRLIYKSLPLNYILIVRNTGLENISQKD